MAKSPKSGKRKRKILDNTGFLDPETEWKRVKKTLIQYSTCSPSSFATGEDKLRRTAKIFDTYRAACVTLGMSTGDAFLREYSFYSKLCTNLASILRKDRSYSQRFGYMINNQVFPG